MTTGQRLSRIRHRHPGSAACAQVGLDRHEERRSGTEHRNQQGDIEGEELRQRHGGLRYRGPRAEAGRARRYAAGMMHEELTVLLDYHYWARDRLLDAVDRLSPDEFRRDLGSSFGSVRDTLVHTMSAEWVWCSRWEGRRARISGRSAPSVRARRAHPGTHPPPPIRPQPLQIPSTHPSAGTQSPRKSGTFSKPRSGTFSKPIDRPSGGWRGVAPSPILRANAENGGEDEVPEGQRGQGLSRSTGCARNGKRSGKRWVLSFCRKMLTPKAAQRANKAVLGSHKHVRPASRCS